MLEYITIKSESLVLKKFNFFMSKALNVNFCLNIAVPSAKPKYILSNR